MDSVDDEAHSAHSDPKANGASTGTLGKKRKRDGVNLTPDPCLTLRGYIALEMMEAQMRKRDGPTKRGILAMKKVIEARKSGIKIPIEFKWGEPIGPNKSTYLDYLGLLGRVKIPLTVKHWRFVPRTTKDAIWEDVKQCFEVDKKIMCMESERVAKAARKFRSKMSKMCFDDEGNPNPHPPSKYANIDLVRDYWKEFVNAQLKENMKDELEKEPPARQNMIIRKPPSVDKDGKIVEEDVQRVVDGDFIAKKFTSDEMMSRGPSSDTSRNTQLINQLEQVILGMSKHLEELESQMIVLRARVRNGEGFHGPTTCISESVSCPMFEPNQSVEGDLGQIPEGESICDLFVESPTYAKVGWGLVFKQEGHKVHNILLNSNEVQVCLKEVAAGHENTLLPIQNEVDEVYTIGDAKGTLVVWPLMLVSLQKKDSEVQSKENSAALPITPCIKKNPAYPRVDDLQPDLCYRICEAFRKNKNNNISEISVLMPDAFWGTAFTDHVSVKHIQEVLKRGWLDATSIVLYIRYLCEVYLHAEDNSAQCSNRNQETRRYSFTSPHIVAGHTHIVDALQKHEGQDHLVMIPYNIEHHWVLIAINTMNEHIYYMDPLRVHHSHPERKSLEDMIQSAMDSYRANKKGSVSSGRSARQIQWFDIECPKHGSSERAYYEYRTSERDYCGYYICLFMEDILESGATTVPTTYIEKRRCATFSDERLEQCEMEWCCYVCNRFLVDVLNKSTI